MATQDIDNDRTIACTLTSADLATQGERWKRLAERAMIERVETEFGLLISFQPEPGVADELRELVAVEKECCSWAEWIVGTRAERVVLDVSSSREGVAALHAMFTTFNGTIRKSMPAPRVRCAGIIGYRTSVNRAD